MLMLRWTARLAVSRTVWSDGGAGPRPGIALSVGIIATAVLLMASMPVMHEHVHQRARRQKEPGQIRDEMRTMLGDNEETADDGEQDEYLLHPSAYGILPRLALFIHRCVLMVTERPSTDHPARAKFHRSVPRLNRL